MAFNNILIEMADKTVKDFSSLTFKVVSFLAEKNKESKPVIDFLIRNIHYRDSTNILKKNIDLMSIQHIRFKATSLINEKMLRLFYK